MRGECLACSRIAECSITSMQKVLSSFTCPLFEEVPGPVYQSRVVLMQQFGEEGAVAAMMMKPTSPDEE